jgi:hypothetical protein
LRLRAMRVGALPILNHFIERMGLEEELTLALKSAGYADALLAPRNQLTVLKCRSNGTSRLIAVPLRSSASKDSSSGLTMSR